MADKYVLSEADRDAIKAMIEAEAKRVATTVNRPAPTDDLPTAPEVYVAKTPDGGIPAATTADDEVTPGVAECDIYRLISGVFTPVEHLVRDVYNIFTTVIPADKWIVVERDKFGQWYAVTASGTEFFPALVSDRRRSENLYSFAERRFLVDGGDALKADGRSGSAGAWVGVERTQLGSVSEVEIQVITLHGVTSGTWYLEGETLPYNADNAAINAALAAALGPGVASAAGAASPFTVTWAEEGAQSELSVNDSELGPHSSHPLYEIDGQIVAYPSHQWVRVGYQANPRFELTKTVTGNGVDEATTWELWLEDWDLSEFTLTVDDEVDPIEDLRTDINAADLEAAIGADLAVTVTGSGTEAEPFVIEVTEDFDDHELSADTSDLIDKTDYRFRAGFSKCFPGVTGFSRFNEENILALTDSECLKVLAAAPCEIPEGETLIISGGTLS